MDSTWILVADSSRARIFEVQDNDLLAQVTHLSHDAAQQPGHTLKTDGEGQFFGSGANGGTAEPAVSPKMHEATLFAEEVNRYLAQGRNQQQFSELHVIAQPRFLGLLRNKLDEQIKSLVVEEIPKDLTKASSEEIQRQITLH